MCVYVNYDITTNLSSKSDGTECEKSERDTINCNSR